MTKLSDSRFLDRIHLRFLIAVSKYDLKQRLKQISCRDPVPSRHNYFFSVKRPILAIDGHDIGARRKLIPQEYGLISFEDLC